MKKQWNEQHSDGRLSAGYDRKCKDTAGLSRPHESRAACGGALKQEDELN
ncbi:MAG: hypothetical protein PHP51_02955 [Desulfotomaculaceae bacterium]|nr:hypothetical protein [Desulfotomaculaceae bacterium]MDD4766860.1 hypothetical protein [Desulfotomaculaceae bacterium]